MARTPKKIKQSGSARRRYLELLASSSPNISIRKRARKQLEQMKGQETNQDPQDAAKRFNSVKEAMARRRAAKSLPSLTERTKSARAALGLSNG